MQREIEGIVFSSESTDAVLSGPRAAEFATLLRACFPDLDPTDTAVELLEIVCGLYSRDQVVWLSARDGKTGELAGIACGAFLSKSLFVFNLSVSPRLRGRGIASNILRLAAAVAIRRGLTTISGSVAVGDTALRSLYEGKLGARKQETMTGISCPGCEPTTIRLEKNITPEDAKPFLS